MPVPPKAQKQMQTRQQRAKILQERAKYEVRFTSCAIEEITLRESSARAGDEASGINFFLRQLNDMTFASLDPRLGRIIPWLRTRISCVSCSYQSIRTLKNVSNKQIPSRTGVLAIKKSVSSEARSDHCVEA
jgi:hypothetical protein